MNRRVTMAERVRLPIWFAVAGAAAKALLIIGWRLSGGVSVFRVLTVFDPVSFWLAEVGVNLILGGRRIAPSPAQALTFEILLVLGFALQCLVLGIVVQSILRGLTRGREGGTASSRPA
jgi:hypothetical protein